MTEQYIDNDLNDEERDALRGVFQEFRQFLSGDDWVKDAKSEAKRRVYARRQAALREQYEQEVLTVEHVEGRLRLRDKYRKMGLEV